MQAAKTSSHCKVLSSWRISLQKRKDNAISTGGRGEQNAQMKVKEEQNQYGTLDSATFQCSLEQMVDKLWANRQQHV